MMELWPFTNFHDLNLDWLIGQWKKLESNLDLIEEYMPRDTCPLICLILAR